MFFPRRGTVAQRITIEILLTLVRCVPHNVSQPHADAVFAPYLRYTTRCDPLSLWSSPSGFFFLALRSAKDRRETGKKRLLRIDHLPLLTIFFTAWVLFRPIPRTLPPTTTTTTTIHQNKKNVVRSTVVHGRVAKCAHGRPDTGVGYDRGGVVVQ